MAAKPGDVLSHYRLIEKIGEGGMGLVYGALDTTLNRKVAIKLLPDAFAEDPERLARLEREAKMLASLNHPNIAAIHGLDRDGGVRFLVLELVPGQTLADRVASGPLPLRETLELGWQIAEALEAAHEKGIVHRDLKPANIKVTPEGKVKLLDFGLAKAFESERPASHPHDSPTLTSDGTRAGVIAGTAAYMSPEQARGKPLDKRTDIWSFGCVLFEALAGRQTFQGETVSDCIARILERDPDWKALPSSTPPRVVDLLKRCLQKDVRQRLRDTGDARIEIEEILRAPSGDAGAASRVLEPSKSPPALWSLAATAVVFVLAGVLVGRWVLPRAASHPEDRPELVEVARLTHDPGLSEWPTWSPDGNLLAFASNRSGNFEIYIRRVEGGQEVNVTSNPAQDFQPAFSPDGNRIAFISTRASRTGMIRIGSSFGLEFRTYGGDLWVAPALGGQAQRLALDANYPAWNPEGGRIAYVTGPESHRSIIEVATDGGSPKTLLSSDQSTWEIVRLQYSPGGHWLSLESAEGLVLLMPASGGTPRKLIDAWSHVWDGSGRRLYSLGRARLGGTRVESVEIDEASGRIGGPPRTLGLMTGILRDLAVARDGQHLAVSESEWSLNLTLQPLDRDGAGVSGPEEILSGGQVIDHYPAFSPDGRRIAFGSDRLGPMEVWIMDLDTRQQHRLQLPGSDMAVNQSYWSHDGRQLLVTRYNSPDQHALWLAAVDGSHAEELIPPMEGLGGGPFSPDGRSFLFTAVKDNRQQVFIYDLGSRKARQMTSSAGEKFEAAWSPDGRFIVFTSNASGASQIWRMPAAGGQEERLTSGDERMRHVFYSPDGRFIYGQPSHRNVYRLPSTGGPLQPVTRFPEAGLFLEEPSLSPDGRFLAYCRINGGASLWEMTIARARGDAR
jgi:eukaryotic-like serine/threonine-protein kinase